MKRLSFWEYLFILVSLAVASLIALHAIDGISRHIDEQLRRSESNSVVQHGGETRGYEVTR